MSRPPLAPHPFARLLVVAATRALQLLFRFWPHEASPNEPKIVEIQIDQDERRCNVRIFRWSRTQPMIRTDRDGA